MARNIRVTSQSLIVIFIVLCFVFSGCNTAANKAQTQSDTKTELDNMLFSKKPTIISHPYFKLTVPNSWKEEKSNDPERHNFLDKKRNLELTISYMDLPIHPDKVREAAQLLAESRIDGHRQFDSRNKSEIFFVGPNIHPKDWGDQVEYQVTDKASYIGTYSGFVASGFNLNIYVHMNNLQTDILDEAVYELLKGMVFSEVVWENVPKREIP